MKYYIESIRRRNMAMLENDGEDFHLYIRRPYGMPCTCLDEVDGDISGVKKRIVPMATDDMNELGTNFDPSVTGAEEANEAKDPEYQGAYRCLQCYGVGVAGGYFPKLALKLRYGNIPLNLMTFEEQGIKQSNNFNSWALWHPRMQERDLLVRLRTNERFLVTDIGQSEWRGIPMHQQFTAVSVPRSAMAFQVTDDTIERALREENAWDVAKWSWALWM